MSFTDVLEINIKPFVYHTCIIMIGLGTIAATWNTSKNEGVFVAFILMILLHYVGGFLLTDHHSRYKNLSSVLLVFIFNFSLALYVQYFDYELQSLIGSVVFAFKLPFLYILGWHGPNYPLLVAFLPSLLLWLGLESKLLINSYRRILLDRNTT
ncbi:hypothetical protein SAMN04490247_0670 [Salimicrobium halophilum]|uniref:Uncharacterized protein n=1 Tax=Salimicrobium halophilum TaxID=86666 RepID=A0A1G8QWF1_9BACI|nr:hypothetical protein SAMN04490247_0670 [Salimicrobium halophilum]